MSKEDIALGMVALKHAMDRVAPAQKVLREQARELLAKKERVPATVNGEVVGTIGKSSPKKSAKVTNETELRRWLACNDYGDALEAVPYVEDMEAVANVLADHAPHLLYYREQVRPDVLTDMLRNSEHTGVPTGPGGEADVPGITVDTPDGTVTVLMEKGNEYLVEQMLTSGQVSLDGAVRRELEG